MRELFFGTIVLVSTVAIVILCFSVFSEPFYEINEALRDSSEAMNNSELTEQLDDKLNKTEAAWLVWPVVFTIGLTIWYFLWGSRWIHERF